MSISKNSDASLAEELPFWDFFADPIPHAVLVDGSLVSGLRVDLMDIECLDVSEVNQFTLGLRSALNSVSEGSSVQFVLSVNSDFSQMLSRHRNGWDKSCHPLAAKIADLRQAALLSSQASGELYRPSLFVFIRVPMNQSKKPSVFKKESAFQARATADYQECLEILSQNIGMLTSSMQGLRLHCEKLVKEDFLRVAYEYLNPRRARLEPAPTLLNGSSQSQLEPELLTASPWLAGTSPREQLVFGDLLLDYEQFTLDSYQHRVITLKTLPEVTYGGMLSSFLRMPFHYDLILSLDVPPQSGEMTKLNQKRRMAHSMAATQGNRASDLESESKLSSTEELIRELLNSGQRIYAAQLTIVLRAPQGVDGRRRLERESREVISRFRSLGGAEGLEESVGSWKVFKGTLPMAPLNLERARKMKTNNLADFLPVYGPREGDADPVVIFENRLGGLRSFNPFDPGLPNYNCLVTGSSGAGKSFLNNCILLQEMARNLRVFIIDIGGSYKKITEALDGQYLEVNLSDQFRINPLDLSDPKAEPSDQKIKSLLSICELMVAEDEKSKLPKLDRVLLEKAIIELYADGRKRGVVPRLSDLTAALESSDELQLRALSKMLYTWTGDRPYGRLLDGPGAFRSDARICTFDLKGLSNYPDLQSVMILILTDFILTEVERDRDHKKRIILDEAWSLLKSPAAANFMEYCARTLRKSGSGITFITQGVEEIVASPIGPAILNNTATKFVMLQRGDSTVLRNALKLNDQELALIHSLEQRKGEFSEGFLIEGDHRQVIRVSPTPVEYWLSTSDAQDNGLIEELREKEGLGLIAAIERAASLFPWGVAADQKGARL